jgi:hypothetical protein
MSLRRCAGILVAAVCLLLCAPWPAAAAAPAPRPIVVLIAVPGLQWLDVAEMPALQQFVAGSAVGELSAKTAGGTTRCSAGILAVTAGNRTGDPMGDCPIPSSSWATLRHTNATSRYGSQIGLLGSALQAAGVARITVGSQSGPLLYDEQGNPGTAAPTFAAAIADAKRAPDGAVVATLDPSLYYLLGITHRAKDAARVEDHLRQELALVPSGATVMVAGISDIATGHAHLHFFAIRGPGWRHTELRSSAAGRAPYVQTIDIAPTILTLEGLPVPSAVAGRPMQQSGAAVRSAAAYVDDDRHAYDQRTLGQRTFLVLGIALIALLLLTLMPWSGARFVARWLARLLAPAPMLVFVANAFPWWRWGQPAFAGLVLLGAVLFAAVTTVASRRSPFAAAAVPLGATLVALVLDQLTGAHLQLSAPLGDSPIVAGRFSGVGNLDFAVIATSALLLGGLVGGRLAGRRGLLAGAAITAAAVVVDGAPQLGDDLGGVFALVPGFIVLVILMFGARVTWRRAAIAAVSTAAVAVAVALADYARPATHQSHVGRFVGQVLHGGAGTEVHRKLNAALASFGPTVGTFVVVVVILTAVVSWPRLRAAMRDLPGLSAAAIAATVTAVLGVCLNDSGVPIAAMAAIVGVPAVYGALGAPRSSSG